MPAQYLATAGFPRFISEHQSGQNYPRKEVAASGCLPSGLLGAELFLPCLPSLALFIQRDHLSFNATNALVPRGSGSQSPVTHLVELCRHFQNTFHHHLPWPVSSQEGNTSDPASVFLNYCTLKLQNMVLSGPLNSGAEATKDLHSGSFLQ